MCNCAILENKAYQEATKEPLTEYSFTISCNKMRIGTFNYYIAGLLACGILGTGALILVFLKLHPFRDGLLAIFLFYLSVFVAVSGILSFILFYLHRIWASNEVYFRNINIAFRQGALLSALLIGLLFLQSYRLLTWWDGLLLTAAVGLIELMFNAKQR